MLWGQLFKGYIIMPIQLVKRKPQVGDATPYGQGKHPLKGIIGGMTMGALAGGAAPANGTPYSGSPTPGVDDSQLQSDSQGDNMLEPDAVQNASASNPDNMPSPYPASTMPNLGKAPGLFANWATNGGAGMAYAQARYNMLSQLMQQQGNMQLQNLRGQQSLAGIGATGEQERQTQGQQQTATSRLSAQQSSQAKDMAMTDAALKIASADNMPITSGADLESYKNAVFNPRLRAATLRDTAGINTAQNEANITGTPDYKTAQAAGMEGSAMAPYYGNLGRVPSIGIGQSVNMPTPGFDYRSTGPLLQGSQSISKKIGPNGMSMGGEQEQSKPQYQPGSFNFGEDNTLPSATPDDLDDYDNTGNQAPPVGSLPSPIPASIGPNLNTSLNNPFIGSPGQPNSNQVLPLNALLNLLKNSQSQIQ